MIQGVHTNRQIKAESESFLGMICRTTAAVFETVLQLQACVRAIRNAITARVAYSC